MAPATAEDDVRFILQALTTVNPLQMNFTEVAKAVGMKQSGHASAKFQAIVKKYQYEYNRPEGKLSVADGVSVGTTPKKSPIKGKQEGAKKPSAKKRKVEVEEDDEDVKDDLKNGATSGEEETKGKCSEENGADDEGP